MEINRKQLLTCKEAAAYLNLNESRIRYEVFLKRIPHIKIGRTVRFATEQLDNWISKYSVECVNE